MTTELIRNMIGQTESTELEYIQKVSQLLPTPFMLKGIDRQEETSAHIALREALANCLIHCNYAQMGNILVVARNSNIMMRNPGCMLISIDEFYAGSHSICRNPTLQKLFMFLGYGEKAGSGADIIKKGWKDNNWPMPVLTERVQPEETLMTLAITTPDSFEVSPENVKTSPETYEVSPEKSSENVQTSQKIIELIRDNKNITMQEMANVLGLNKRSVARNIKKLQEHGIIRRIGANKNGYWEIIV